MWEDPRKMICPDCNGNGYVGTSTKPDEQEDCKLCKNQGEVKITEKNLQRLRESGLQTVSTWMVSICGSYSSIDGEM